MAPSHQHPGYAPSLEKLLQSKLPLESSIETAASLLKRHQVHGPEPCAVITAHVLSQVVAKAKWTDVDQLLDRVYQVGRKLIDAQPQELVIGNIVRRVMGLIRDEAIEDRNDANPTPPGTSDGPSTVPDLRVGSGAETASNSPSLTPSQSYTTLPRTLNRQASLVHTSQSMFNLLSAIDPASSSLSASAEVSSAGSGASTPVTAGGPPGLVHTPSFIGSSGVGALRSEIIDGIEEIRDEIGQADDQIAGFAESQIRPSDCVMVYAPSKSVEKFLIKAAARRRYTLLLVQGSSTAPDQYAPLLKRLAATKVHVIRVPSTAVSAYMTRVNRVVLEARAMSPNGGVLVDSGGARVARAARASGRTVLVIGGVYRVSPETWTDPEALIEWGSPANLVRFADGSMVNSVNIETALTEYIAPGLVDIYVTNLGPHSRDYLDTIIADHYKREDVELYAH